MTSNQERAAEVLYRHGAYCGECGWEETPDCPDCKTALETYVRALADAGLLTPDGMTAEWEATVAWMNGAGQSEQATGYGTTREEALADARGQDRWLTTATEVAHRCAHRHVTEWAAEETTITEQEASNE